MTSMVRFHIITLAVITLLTNAVSAQTDTIDSYLVGVASQWMKDAIGDTGRYSAQSVFMIVATKTQKKGTGFALADGPIITNYHVIRDCDPSDLFALSAFGEHIHFNRVVTDSIRDLAALFPDKPHRAGLRLAPNSNLPVGSLVSTWGFPLSYASPPPLLTVGYLSGFRAHKPYSSSPIIIKRLVINGAFNSGNSGGPLLDSTGYRVVGVVVEKALPTFTRFEQSVIKTFSRNDSEGVIWTLPDEQGVPKEYSEVHLLIQLISQLREMGQTVIGEAIAVNELRDFLNENGISFSQ